MLFQEKKMMYDNKRKEKQAEERMSCRKEIELIFLLLKMLEMNFANLY